MTTIVRLPRPRVIPVVLCSVVSCALALIMTATSAAAAPAAPTPAAQAPAAQAPAAPAVGAAAPGEDEGAPPSLRQVLDTSLQQYNDAQGRLDASVQRQSALAASITATQLKLHLLVDEVGTVAATAYRGGRLNMADAVLDSGSPEALLHTAATVQYLAWRDDQQLRELTATEAALIDQRAAADAEVRLQQQQVAIMGQRKNDALVALAKTGGGQLSTGVVPGQATAKPAPRNPDGSWPPEKCVLKDPTPTGGCITARLRHAYDEARLAGFTHFTSCFRPSGPGEHPKGRACDFSANATTFVDARATGADKAYGDRLAGWLIANASRLGVLYVIWYKQIWFPDRGWRSYTGDGTPAGDHYNHVHLSVQ